MHCCWRARPDERLGIHGHPVAFGRSPRETPKPIRGNWPDSIPLFAGATLVVESSQFCPALRLILDRSQSCLFRLNFNDATFSAISFDLPIFNRGLFTTDGRHSPHPEDTCPEVVLGGAMVGK